jgi:glycosyltransferase involved in cell wall biosynthesis
MRILHIAESYPPTSGGVARVLQCLSEGLVRLGHDVTVATRVNPLRDFKVLNGVKVVSFDVDGKVDTGYTGEVRRYQEFVCTFPCDVLMVYAAQTWAADLVFPLLEELKCVKVFEPCGYSSLYNPDYAEYFKQLPSALKNFDHIVYLDANFRDALFGRRHNIDHYSIIPEGADLSEFGTEKKKGFRKRYKIRTKYMLLNVASYNRNKAQHFLLEAFLRAKPVDTTLVCIGPNAVGRSSRIYFRLLQIASIAIQMRLGFGTIRLLRNVGRDWVVAAFQEADLFLLGSSFEAAIPIAIHEAMAAGVPFISNRCGSLEEIEGGIVVTSPYEMSRGISILLANKRLRDELSEKGGAAAKTMYGFDKMVKAFEDLYQRLLSCKQTMQSSCLTHPLQVENTPG